MQAAIREINYRTFDSLLDSVRLDLRSYNQNGDIDAADLIKVALEINYELGVKINTWKETMIEICHNRARLPADFQQAQLVLACYHYTHIQSAPWNGNVLLEEIVPSAPSTCPCWTVVSAGYQTTYVDCTDVTHTIYFAPGTSTLCAKSINTTTGTGGSITVTTDHFCYNDNTNGVYICTPPDTCNICNTFHSGNCAQPVVNPYPLGCTRTICEGTGQQTTIKVHKYCESSIQCYEQFTRLYPVPYRQAEGFNRQGQFRENTDVFSINGGFIETPGIEHGQVYIQYLGALEDEQGNLLVLDHPKINLYYEMRFAERILRNLYWNGEADIKQRLEDIRKELDTVRWQALSIVNMPNLRNTLLTINTIRANHNRQYWHTISRYWGYLGWANPVDNM